jgi:3-oxoacyl-[acyl-carrier-protein] synthase-3
VADALGVGGDAQLYDVSNACLGAVNGMIQVASAIELGQIRAGLVVCAESAREIVDSSIDRMLSRPDMEMFKTTFATMTGGSGAAAILLADEALAGDAHRLIGGVARAAPQHHRLCRWGPEGTPDGREAPPLETHAVDVLENGVDLAIGTWRDFLALTGWRDGPDRTICHQVAAANRDALLKAIRVSPERDFATFPYLGNMGTASLPVTAALAAERGFVQRGDRVGLLGIGSGLNCLMLAVEW